MLLAVALAVVAGCAAGLFDPATGLSFLLFGGLLVAGAVVAYTCSAEVAGPAGRHWIAIHDGGLAIRSQHGEPLVLPWSWVRLEETPIDPGGRRPNLGGCSGTTSRSPRRLIADELTPTKEHPDLARQPQAPAPDYGKPVIRSG